MLVSTSPTFTAECIVGYGYESDNSVMSQRLVENLHLPTNTNLDQAWIRFTTR